MERKTERERAVRDREERREPKSLLQANITIDHRSQITEESKERERQRKRRDRQRREERKHREKRTERD